ncbi:NAD(P)H-binding protein [Streptomyces sp. HSW2009]|uniref:SDR family oxidoreductase n=1 Tax=Streptomyces sp. HSW2009 TaxID=3142890 RepID=UPI0032EC36CE
MILVTAATGNIGTDLLAQLRASGVGPVRALTRDATRAAFPAGVTAVEGSLTDPVSWAAALAGVRALFLVPHLGPDADLLRAAREAGVAHTVLVSSITVQTHPRLAPAAAHRQVEEYLKGSGMGWTILRPTQFASNTYQWADSIRADATVSAPYADTALPTIDPADIASVARAALTDPSRHHGHTYALTGPAPVSPRHQVAPNAAARAREVGFTEISREVAHARLAPVYGAEFADAVLDVTGGDVTPELLRVRDTVEQVTGVPARTFEQWATEHVAAFR